MTLNGVMAVALRYFTEFGKPALQKTICGGIYARDYCIFSACTMSSQRKFTFAISSTDEFLVKACCASFLWPDRRPYQPDTDDINCAGAVEAGVHPASTEDADAAAADGLPVDLDNTGAHP